MKTIKLQLDEEQLTLFKELCEETFMSDGVPYWNAPHGDLTLWGLCANGLVELNTFNDEPNIDRVFFTDMGVDVADTLGISMYPDNTLPSPVQYDTINVTEV